MRRFAFIVLSILSVSNARADCGKLGPGDTFAQLNVILECQEQRIKALEQKQGAGKSVAGNIGVTPSPDAIWSNGKCFPYTLGQAFKISITIEEQHEPIVLCWSDGTVMARVARFMGDSAIAITDPANMLAKGTELRSSIYDGCKFNRACAISTPDAKLIFSPQLLSAADGRKRARLHIEARPN